MKKVEIIEMVASHYNLSNRAIGFFGDCLYRTDDGKMCAVGMCMNDEAINEYGCFSETIVGINHRLEKEKAPLDTIFKEEYKGHSLSFWNHVQKLHDAEINWTNDGLSNEGKQKVYNLINKYK